MSVFVPFPRPLVRGTLIRRYKRFLADVRLDDGREITAHSVNPGRMTGLQTPGTTVWLSPQDNPKRKLAWTWEIGTDDRGPMVGVNAILANRLVAEALAANVIPTLEGYGAIKREVRFEDARIDFTLEGHACDPRRAWVEVKSATLGLGEGVVAFPDAPSARGRRHLSTLATLAAAGDRAVLLFLVQRVDAKTVVPADAVDPEYGQLLREVATRGVEVLALMATPDPAGITVGGMVPVSLAPV